MLPPRGLICKPHFLDTRQKMLAKHGSVWARGDHLQHHASICLAPCRLAKQRVKQPVVHGVWHLEYSRLFLDIVLSGYMTYNATVSSRA